MNAVTSKPARSFRERLVRNDFSRYSKLEFGYGRYCDQTEISGLFRNLFRENPELRAAMRSRPFDHPEAQWMPPRCQMRSVHFGERCGDLL